jgi:hypothetical protein
MKNQPIPIKATAERDPLTAFCEELCGPLEEIFNLVYIVRHKKTDSALGKRYLTVVDERLQEVREVVMSHCKNAPPRVDKAS